MTTRRAGSSGDGVPLPAGVVRTVGAMTRWARKVAAAGGKALKSTPWEEMAAGPAEGGPERKNKRKKAYQNEDVNGFAAYLKQAGNGRGREEEEEEEAAAAALKKDRRREGRRLRRQEARKNAMVSWVPAVVEGKGASQP